MQPPEINSIVGILPAEVQWGDCDAAGIIFYPTYFRWFDAATWALFASVGYPAKRMRAEHLAMPLVAADCEFKAPAEQQDRAEVRSRTSSASRKRMHGRKNFVPRQCARAERSGKSSVPRTRSSI